MKGSTPPIIEDVELIGPTLPDKPVKVRAVAQDFESGILNVTLRYSTSFDDDDMPLNVHEMKI